MQALESIVAASLLASIFFIYMVWQQEFAFRIETALNQQTWLHETHLEAPTTKDCRSLRRQRFRAKRLIFDSKVALSGFDSGDCMGLIVPKADIPGPPSRSRFLHNFKHLIPTP